MDNELNQILPLLVPLPSDEETSESDLSSISSISDSSSDDQALLGQMVRIPRPRILHYMEVVNQYSDEEFRTHFRYAFKIILNL